MLANIIFWKRKGVSWNEYVICSNKSFKKINGGNSSYIHKTTRNIWFVKHYRCKYATPLFLNRRCVLIWEFLIYEGGLTENVFSIKNYYNVKNIFYFSTDPLAPKSNLLEICICLRYYLFICLKSFSTEPIFFWIKK